MSHLPFLFNHSSSLLTCPTSKQTQPRTTSPSITQPHPLISLNPASSSSSTLTQQPTSPSFSPTYSSCHLPSLPERLSYPLPRAPQQTVPRRLPLSQWRHWRGRRRLPVLQGGAGGMQQGLGRWGRCWRGRCVLGRGSGCGVARRRRDGGRWLVGCRLWRRGMWMGWVEGGWGGGVAGGGEWLGSRGEGGPGDWWWWAHGAVSGRRRRWRHYNELLNRGYLPEEVSSYWLDVVR